MNNIDNFPRVLLFGHDFNDKTGMGITLTNLFANWPSENIAVFSNGIDYETIKKIRPCDVCIGTPRKTYPIRNNESFKSKIRNYIRNIYVRLGINELKYKPSFLEEDLQQVRAFNPEIIFTALGSIESMERTKLLMSKFPESNLVIYIVDDWVNTRCKEKYFSAYWTQRFDKSFRDLLQLSSGNLSICSSMSESYLKQYGKYFVPFHNPVDIDYWNSLDTVSKYSNDIKSILYLGKINKDTKPCILDLAQVVDELNKEGYNYVFDVYSPDSRANVNLLSQYDGCNLEDAISHEFVPSLMKGYNSLFLPLGFSDESRRYVRLSMPTKLSEYLASGKPTILYCPEEIALAKYVISKQCAIVCTENNREKLKEAVVSLTDQKYYDQQVQIALSVAKEHDFTIVRERFKMTLLSFVK